MSNNLYITGLNGSSEKGLGKLLKEEYGFNVLEINPVFDKLPFDKKVEKIKKLISNREIIIANSLGGYLLLNALTTNVKASILLISPVLGMALVNGAGRIPPNLSRFKDSIKNKSLFIPSKTEIISGADDDVCPVGNIKFLQEFYPEINVEIIKGEKHQIASDTVKSRIDKFISTIKILSH